MEIVVRQISGLGNQLFQYAAGRYYARKFGAELRIATDLESRAESYGYPRPFLLRKFAISAPSREITSMERLLLSEDPRLLPVSAVARKVLRTQIIREPWLERYTFHSELPVHKKAQTIFLLGYWQVHSLADAIASELRAEFSLIEPAQGPNLDMLIRIQRAHHPVSVHIRRGDYTLSAEGNAALPVSYYLHCIRIMQERLGGEPTFFVFSDDIGYAREHLPRDADLVFVDHNDAFSAHQDLRLMSLCHHHIIANSTMSWWGAWLDPRAEKIVLAPKHWRVGGATESPDLIPREWILVDDAMAEVPVSGFAPSKS